MVDENVFEETALEVLPTEIIKMTPEQIELEKIQIQARMELERNRMELEKARIEQEMRLQEVDLARRGCRRSHDSFEVTKQARLVPKFEEANVDFERTALNLGWLRECWSMLLQTGGIKCQAAPSSHVRKINSRLGILIILPSQYNSLQILFLSVEKND